MKTVSISVTEAARNFSDCINRARYQGTTFLLHKNGVLVARLAPEDAPVKKATKGRELANALREALQEVHLGEEEAAAWQAELEESRRGQRPPVSKWQP
jgi:antitoxin (DNA-binding transcriptional repressor) of toxin-antitoxin stability system